MGLSIHFSPSQHKFFETNQALLCGKQTVSQLPPPDIQASTVPRLQMPERDRTSPFGQVSSGGDNISVRSVVVNVGWWIGWRGGS